MFITIKNHNKYLADMCLKHYEEVQELNSNEMTLVKKLRESDQEVFELNQRIEQLLSFTSEELIEEKVKQFECKYTEV